LSKDELILNFVYVFKIIKMNALQYQRLEFPFIGIVHHFA